MEQILSIAQTISPLGIIALLVIVILELVGGKGVLNRIRGTQKEKYPELEKHMNAMIRLTQQNETLLENHFKHEIPAMVESINKIDKKIDKVTEKQTDISDRLLILETKFSLNRSKKKKNNEEE